MKVDTGHIMGNYFFPNLSVFYSGIAAFLTAVFLMLILGPAFIKKMQNFVQPIRTDGIQEHLVSKKNTPTCGGLLMVAVFLVTCIVWVEFNRLILGILFTGIAFAILGFVDDAQKLKNKNSAGVSGKARLILGFAIGLIAGYLMVKSYPSPIGHSIYFPFINYFYINIHGLIYAWIALVIVATANSVNLTDGLDGLASLVVLIVLLSFGIILTVINCHGMYQHFILASNFKLHVAANQILVVIMALVGTVIGFLWFNAPRAQIFMGDVGSLFLGGTLSAIAVAIKHELILVIAGIILVLEAASVIIQIYSYKLRKKRFFLMAPLHHHFEKKGIPEIKITFRFFIVTIIASAVALMLIDY